ncbi:hypothetical protein ABPG74_011436 [Tetrahymena malaccensis]
MDQQTHRSIQKKDKKRLFQEQIIEGSKQNDVTFNLNGLHINSQTRREEINSLIDHQNELVSQGSPSLNQFLQTSQISKTQIQSEKYKSLIVDKNEFQDSINESDKELPTVSQVQNTVQRSRSSNHLKSIFLSDNNKKHIQRSKQNLKVMMGFRGSQVQEKKFINFVLLKQIHQKMTYFLNNFTSTGRIKFLNNEKHLQIRKAINDNVDYIQPKNNDKVVLFIRCIFNYLSCFSVFKWFCQNSCCFIIVPNSLFNMLSLVFFCSFNYLFFFLLSIIIIYQGYLTYEKMIVFFIITIWILDIFVQLNTQIYKKTNLISDREKIISQYIKNRAIYDMIPLASIFLSIYTFDRLYIQKCLQILSFLKLKNVFKDTNNMQKQLCMSVKNYYIIQLLNLIFKISALSHTVACFWYLIGQIELHLLKEETTWYDESIGSDGVWWKLYLQSMYWSLTLMITGSNEAKTTAQMFYTSFIMLFTAIIFGYMLNTTGIILSQLNQRDEEKRKDLNILNDFMRQHKISKGLQGRVNLDLEYQYLHNLKQDQEQKEEVISKISPHLQKLLKVEQTKQALEKFNFLSKYFSKETMQDLSLEFNEEFYSPNQVVFQDKQVNNLSMILILQGSLQICQQIDKQTQPVQFLKEGDIIGQINFFTGLEFQYSVKSVDFTKVIKINREKFLEIIQKREKDYEKYCQIRDKQQFYMQYNTVQVKCAFCHQYTHLTTQCSLVHLDTQGSVFVAKFQQNFQQTRSKYLRKQIDQNSYMIRLAVQKSVNKYMLEEKKAQKINTFIQKKNNLLSNDSNEYESENSIRMFSTYQILSSQQSSEEENQQSTVMAQKVKNSRYFDSNKIIQLNQNTHKRKKSQEITSLRDINTQQTQPLNHIQLDIVNKYYDQTKKRGSIFQTKKDKKHRNSIQVIDFNKKNYIQEVESVSKRLSAQFQNNNFNSSNQNDDSPHVKSKQRITQDMSMTPSNSIQKQEQQIGFQQQHNTSKLVNSKKRDKKTDYENYIRRAQKRQTSIIQKPMSQIQILEEEKNQPLFIFDFDIHKQWQIYFPQGNLVNILQKFNKRMRKKTKHYTVYDKKKDKTEKKQAD